MTEVEGVNSTQHQSTHHAHSTTDSPKPTTGDHNFQSTEIPSRTVASFKTEEIHTVTPISTSKKTVTDQDLSLTTSSKITSWKVKKLVESSSMPSITAENSHSVHDGNISSTSNQYKPQNSSNAYFTSFLPADKMVARRK